MSENDYATKYDLTAVDNRLSEEIKENRTAITQHSQEIARLSALYNTLEDLPQTFANLDKTISLVGTNLARLESKMNDICTSVDEQNIAVLKLQNTNAYQNELIEELTNSDKKQSDEISKVDAKGKIDLVSALTANFWKILAIAATAYGVIQTLMK